MFLPETRMKWNILRKKFLSKFLGKSIDVKDSWTSTPAALGNMVDFLNWFDTTASVAECLEKAQRDWHYRFQLSPQFNKVDKGAALEIGFGAGRLLHQAAKEFREVYGVDIHGAFDKSREFLRMNGVENPKLFLRNEISGVPDESIDFVYSFIVFQHFDSVDEVRFYLDAIRRILKKNGYAHIYFGKNPDRGVTVTKPEDFQLRDCSLFIEPAMMRELISQQFEILEFQDKLPRDPEKNTGESVQASVIFRRK
ncbi:MAG: class I SAM-dependent methyltransferase [Bacteriovoracia bacterium]